MDPIQLLEIESGGATSSNNNNNIIITTIFDVISRLVDITSPCRRSSLP